MSVDRQVSGSYKMACEASPNRDKIDAWLNEGKEMKWISDQLKELDDYISPNSVSKYKKMREERIMNELRETPEFQAKQQIITEQFNDSVGKIRQVDLIGNLTQLIDDSAVLLAQSKEDDIRIHSVKDLRMVQQTMLDAIQIYGETMLNAQKFEAINNDPTLLQKNQTTININVKNALTDLLKGAVEDGGDGFSFIDKLRSGISNT